MGSTKCNYSKRTWLNDVESDSTGSMVVFDGVVTTNEGTKEDWSFLEISDCRNKVRLHKTIDDSREDFIKKLQLIQNEVDEFIKHLKTKKV